jgi:NAD(P)-dependent dehydrogenase (short-subunit alcohol dehydrogenase family)
MSWSTDDIPDLTGRVAVITGANGGLGLETARALAAKGAHVVMAARNAAKAAAAESDVRTTVAGASIEVRALDLASLESVRQFATDLVGDHAVVDILVNNAGVMGIPEQHTADGFEMQFGVNHLGHFALTALLLPALLAVPAARVVTVTSTARHFGRPVDPANPHLRGVYAPWRAYNQSKLANVHFALGLQHRFDSAGVGAASLVAHPGLSRTDLQPNSVRQTGGGASQRFWESYVARTGMSAASGALPQVRAATDPSARGGELYAPRFVNFGSPVRRPLLGRSRDQGAIDTLWAVSERETGLPFELGAG